MRITKILSLVLVILALCLFITSTSHVRAEDEEDETRTSAQFYPYFGPYGFYDAPYVAPYGPFGEFFRIYGFSSGIIPYGCCTDLFGIHNLYYPVELQGTGLVYQFPFVQIAPYLGAAAFWQKQFPNADWSKVLATQFLGLINLPGLPRLF